MAAASESHSALRILENLYTGVAYYLPDRFEKAGDLERVVRALEVAVEIFPQRVRGHWRLAAAYAKAGRAEAALGALKRATSYGNVDIERLKADPAWEPLRDRPEWGELVASLERGSG